MKLGFLILNLDVRGSVRRVVELSNRMVDRGHEVTVYTTKGEGCSWLPLKAKLGTDEDVLFDQLDVLVYFCEPTHLDLMRDAPAKRRFAYMLGINEREAAWCAQALTGAGTGRIGPRTRAVYHSIREFEVIANCEALSAWFRGLGVKCETVPGGVDAGLFKPCSCKTPFAVLSGGARRAIEGTQEVLLVRDQVKAVEARASFMFYAGMGKSQEDLAALYSSADVFLDAQWYGGWNNPVAEAMACRTAVVCTDIHGNGELAIDGETALVVPVGAVEQMTAAVLRLFQDGSLRTKLAANGFRHVQQFTWDAAADAFEGAVCGSS